MTQKMLIIDNEDDVLELCRKTFTQKGFDVVTTTSPKEGIQLLKDSSFDVVICDWELAKNNNKYTMNELKKFSSDMAVIIISNTNTADHIKSAMQNGALDFIAKPLDPDKISKAVDDAISRNIEKRKETLEQAEKIVRNIKFPVPDSEDKSPPTIAETVAKSVGVKKVTSPCLSVIILGILAGAYIGFGGVLATSVTFDMAKYLGIGFSKFMSGAVFSVGLMLVVIAGAELFTGNNLMITSTLVRRITFWKMMRRWGLVFVSNFIGSLIIVMLFYLSGLWKTGGNAIGVKAVAIAYKKVSLTWVEALTRAIGCNWLVCLAVWMALAAKQTIGKIFAIFFPIMAFVAIGFEHVVANMYFIPMGIVLHNLAGITLSGVSNLNILNWGNFVVKNLIPVTIGNIIGGSLFVGMGYWSAYLKENNNKSFNHSK